MNVLCGSVGTGLISHARTSRMHLAGVRKLDVCHCCCCCCCCWPDTCGSLICCRIIRCELHAHTIFASESRRISRQSETPVPVRSRKTFGDFFAQLPSHRLKLGRDTRRVHTPWGHFSPYSCVFSCFQFSLPHASGHITSSISVLQETWLQVSGAYSSERPALRTAPTRRPPPPASSCKVKRVSTKCHGPNCTGVGVKPVRG